MTQLTAGQKDMLRRIAAGEINDIGGVPRGAQGALYTGERLTVNNLVNKGLAVWISRHVELTEDGAVALAELEEARAL